MRARDVKEGHIYIAVREFTNPGGIEFRDKVGDRFAKGSLFKCVANRGGTDPGFQVAKPNGERFYNNTSGRSNLVWLSGYMRNIQPYKEKDFFDSRNDSMIARMNAIIKVET